MQIYRSRLIEGARTARGAVVIIDVFRAFSVCAYAAALGARPLLAAADTGVARSFKARRPQTLLSGEEGGWPIEGFDLGNSPTALLQMVAGGKRVQGRPFLQRTSSGTQGLMAAAGRAGWLFAASLVNAQATAAAVRALRPPAVTLVAMGLGGSEPAIEDEVCAQAIEAYLKGEPWDTAAAAATLYGSDRVRRLLAGAFEPFAPSDVQLCLAFNLFPFTLRARRRGALAVIRPFVAPGGRHRPGEGQRPAVSAGGPPEPPAPPSALPPGQPRGRGR